MNALSRGTPKNTPTTARFGARSEHKASGGEIACRCGGPLVAVVDSRPSVIGASNTPVVRRRRKCSQCGQRTTTIEVTEDFLVDCRAEILRSIAMQIIGGEIK